MERLEYLALGDSYTIGEAVPFDQSLPAQICSGLRRLGIQSHPTVVAETGWTAAELLAALEESSPAFGSFDLVTLLIGVNNQYRGLPLEAYKEDFRTLLDRAAAFTRKGAVELFVLSIPDWGSTPFGAAFDRKKVSSEIDRFNEVNRVLSAEAGAHYTDITALSRSNAPKRLLAPDGLHPAGELYALWVKQVLPEIISRCQNTWTTNNNDSF